jgi:pSer/pThr/pTyr-binding forkhead associated (FHA) protein
MTPDRDAAASGPVLEVVAGPARGERVATEQEALEIGRHAAGAGTLGEDQELSRRHARIERLGDGRLLIEDLGSTNGTFVNASRIGAPTILSLGDEVDVGASRLRVVPAAVAQPAAASPGSAPSKRQPALRVVAGFAPGALISIEEGTVTLGRTGAGAKALGGDSGVADEHLRVSPTADRRLLVEDLGSPGGTFIGDTRIHAPTLVAAGDRVRVGRTTLEVVQAAQLPSALSGVSRVLGGVRRLPEDLFSRIAARAPVTRQDVVPVLLLALGWAFAANLLVRTLAIEVVHVPKDLRALELRTLVPSTFCPVFFNSLGFYKSFQRPTDRSMTKYLIPTFGVPTFFLVLNVVLMNHRGLAETITTVVMVLVPVSIGAPLMLRLRARVARQRVGAVRGADR